MVSNTPSVRQAAIASLALLAGYAEAADKYFEFPSCVLSCIRADACNGNTKCMCSSARTTNFLDKVVTCAVPGCASSSRAVSMKTQFLDVMDDGCDALRMGIPKDKLKAAEKLAASLVAKLPPPTPVRPDPTQNPPSPTKGPPVQSPPSPPPATDIDDEPTPQPTTSRDRGGGGGGGGSSSSSPATKVPDTVVPPQPTDTPAQPPPAGVTTYPPPAQTPTQAPPPPPPPAGNGRRPDPTDSTPFALPINTAPSLSVSSWLLAGLVGVAALWL